MSLNASPHLNKLKEILELKNSIMIYPCIKDLVSNGLTLSRFSIDESKPSRQDITQYIAAWFKYTGVTAEQCRDWMIEYCLDVLSVLSSSSLSRIRHSTKSNIKYIFNSDVEFDCRCENNIFKAECDKDCPAYKEMSEKYKERIKREENKSYEIYKRPGKIQFIPKYIPVKEKHKDQFENAIKAACEYLKNGVSKKDIVRFLNERDFKTRTGRKWTYDTLNIELKRKV